MDYADLPEPIKMDNMAATFRIPWVVSLAGLHLLDLTDEKRAAVPVEALQKIIEEHLDATKPPPHDG